MALGLEELSLPCEDWAVVRHHVSACTLSKVSLQDTQDALVEDTDSAPLLPPALTVLDWFAGTDAVRPAAELPPR